MGGHNTNGQNANVIDHATPTLVIILNSAIAKVN